MSAGPSIERWRAEAQRIVEPAGLRVPFRTLLGESVEVAKFFGQYYQPTDSRPGLSSAGAKLPSSTDEDILSLRDAVQDAETAYQLVVEPKVDTEALKGRGTEVLNDITATLEWYLDDGVETDEDVQLANLKSAHANDTGAADDLAQALHDYATLSRPMAGALGGLGDFDAAEIDEALEIADKLGQVSLTPNARSEKAREAKLLRDQLSCLLSEKIRLVRSAARFVFRKHPDIARQATSAYERRRRAEARRAKAKAEAAVDPDVAKSQ